MTKYEIISNFIRILEKNIPDDNLTSSELNLFKMRFGNDVIDFIISSLNYSSSKKLIEYFQNIYSDIQNCRYLGDYPKYIIDYYLNF